MGESGRIGRYELFDQIGKGSYATVYKAINTQTGEICAIKKFSETTITNLTTEISIISKSKCENIVRFLGSDCIGRGLIIVMEYCPGGSVKDAMLRSGRTTMSYDEIIVIVRDVLNALDYLHQTHMIHRDVKSANILLSEAGVAKLSDFGVSEDVRTRPSRGKLIGTPLWVPPEILNHDKDYSTAIDIWSLGITIIEIGDGKPPYNDIDQMLAIAEISNMNKPPPTFKEPSKWPQDLIDFLGLCLQKDARQRKRAHDLLTCKIMQKVTSHDVIKKLVAEACSNTAKQTKYGLHRKLQTSFKECMILYKILNGRRGKEMEVDKMCEFYRSVSEKLEQLLNLNKQKNRHLNETIQKWKLLIEDTRKLDLERTKLGRILEERRDRKAQILKQLNKIKEQHHDMTERKLTKLRSLEERSS